MNAELGKCDQCGKENTHLKRTYYKYFLTCKCCGEGKHFEIVRTCLNCVPRPPLMIKLYPTDDLLKTK